MFTKTRLRVSIRRQRWAFTKIVTSKAVLKNEHLRIFFVWIGDVYDTAWKHLHAKTSLAYSRTNWSQSLNSWKIQFKTFLSGRFNAPGELKIRFVPGRVAAMVYVVVYGLYHSYHFVNTFNLQHFTHSLAVKHNNCAFFDNSMKLPMVVN